MPSIEGLTKDSDLSTVAKSGSYEDLINKPTIPDITGLATETYVDNKVADYTKTVDLADVATSGSYNDLADKPTIPSLDGYAKTSEIPSKVSELENDSNYLSSIPEEYVTDTELDAKGYLTEHQDISGKVDKVEGKSLISDTEIARLASVDNYDDTALSNRVKTVEDEVPNLATKTYVGEQIANAEHLKREIVTVLPSDTEASDNIIYMLKVESATGNDKYQEYMKIDGTVQMVGDTSVDLTDYAKTVDIPTTVAELTDSSDYAKKTDIPTTLPANGGNADTVNNHTVKSDVPENAVFTDTVYDDTEIKWSISELNERAVFYDDSDNTDEGKWLGDLLGKEIMRLSLDCDEDGNLTLYYGDNQVTSVKIVGCGGSIIPCESIELNVSSIKLRDIDTSYILSATPSPTTTTQKVRWSTTDSNIATVSNDGTVTLTGKTGTVTINAICGSQSASCDITVISRITKTVYDFWTIMNNKGIVGGYERIYINHLGNETTNTSDCFSAPKLPVIAGDKITGTFTSRGIPVCYYDSEGNIVWDALPYRPETSGEIVEYTVNSVVPEGVSYVKVSSMNGGGNIGTPYLTAYDIY